MRTPSLWHVVYAPTYSRTAYRIGCVMYPRKAAPCCRVRGGEDIVKQLREGYPQLPPDLLLTISRGLAAKMTSELGEHDMVPTWHA